MPLAGQTQYFQIPKEPNSTGIADARTFNAAMDYIDDLFWRQIKIWGNPVATVGDLPATGNFDGEARVVLADSEIYVWSVPLGAWQASTVGGNEHWKGPVVNATALPATGNSVGDVRLAVDTRVFYSWTGVAWAVAGSAGGFALTVIVAKAGGDFAVIQDAIDSITVGAGEKWAVIVYPGVYEENVTLKNGVSLMGAGAVGDTVIYNTSGDVLTLGSTSGDRSTVENLSVKLTVSGSNTPHALVSTAAFSVGIFTNVVFDVDIENGYLDALDLSGGILVFNDCSYQYTHTGTGGGDHTFFMVSADGVINILNGFGFMKVSSIATTDYIKFVDDARTNNLFQVVSDVIAALDAETASYDGHAEFYKVSGPSTNNSVKNCKVAIATPSGAANSLGAIYDLDSGSAIIRSTANQFTVEGFFVNYLGEVAAGDTLVSHMDDVVAVDEWTGAGTFKFASSFRDGDFNVSEELWLGIDRLVDAVPLAAYSRDSISTGHVSGGVVTRDTGLNVDVALGVGYINTGTGVIRIEWDAKAALVLTANSVNWIYVTTAGVVAQATIQPDHDLNIILASSYTGAASVDFLSKHVVEIPQSRPSAQVYATEVIGPITVSGCVATKNGTAKRIDVGPGVYYTSTDRNIATANAPITFVYWYRDGSGGWTKVLSSTIVDTGFYDSDTGTLTAMTSSLWKKDLLYVAVSGDGTEYHIVYGQEEFASQILAEEGNNPIPPALLNTESLRVAGAVVQEGGAVITSLVDSRPFLGQFASGSTSTTDHGSLSGLPDDDHTQYQLRTEQDVANGYPSLDGSSKLTGTQQVYGDLANTAIEGNNTRVLTQAENDAAQGTSGAPSNTNRYVTDEDSRLKQSWDVTPGDNTGPGASAGAATPTVLRYKVWPGTTVFGTPTTFSILARSSSGNPGVLEIYDEDAGLLVAQITGIVSTAVGGAIYTVTAPWTGTFPAGVTRFSIRVYRSGSAATITLFDLGIS